MRFIYCFLYFLAISPFLSYGQGGGGEVFLRPGPDCGKDALVWNAPGFNNANINYGDDPSIGAHAWTFAGSGQFSVRLTGDPVFAIAGCPMCRGRHASRPTCSYYRATFEHLLRRLIHSRLTVAEVACEAVGGASCEFRITIP